MKKLLLTLFAFLIAIDVAYPQLAIRHRLATPKPADTLDIDYYSHKRGLQAGTMSSASIWESGLSTAISVRLTLPTSMGVPSRTTSSMVSCGTMTPWVPICSCTPTTVACTSTQPDPTDTISGSPGSLPSAAASCRRCLWKTSTPLPTTSLPPPLAVWPWGK